MTSSSVDIVSGYQSGCIGRVTSLHALYYAKAARFGIKFESVVATGLADFCARLEKSSNQIWLAMEGDEIVGCIAIDGEDLGPGIAHLRWFIVSDRMQGRGAGRRLLETALAFADRGRNSLVDVRWPESRETPLRGTWIQMRRETAWNAVGCRSLGTTVRASLKEAATRRSRQVTMPCAAGRTRKSPLAWQG